MSDFDHLFDQLAKAAAQPFQVPEVEAEGRSDDDLIVITMAAGQVSEVTVHPLATRLGTAELADHIQSAINGAIAAHSERLVEAMQGQQADPGALQGNLEQIRTETSQSMQRYLQSMEDMMRQATGQRARFES